MNLREFFVSYSEDKNFRVRHIPNIDKIKPDKIVTLNRMKIPTKWTWKWNKENENKKTHTGERVKKK